MLLAFIAIEYAELVVHQNSCSSDLFLQCCFLISLYCCKGLFYPRCSITVFAFVELQLCVSLVLQPFEIPLNGSLAIKCISCFPWFSVTHKLIEIYVTFTLNAVYSGGCGRECCDLKNALFHTLWFKSCDQGVAVISWCTLSFLCLNWCVAATRRLQTVSQHFSMVS